MIRSKIAGLGAYLPSKVVTNHDLEKIMDTSDEWILKRTGVRQRRWVEPDGESTSDLALQASIKALENAQMDAKDLDMIILATVSPDHEFPGTGCFLQHKLGISDIAVYDIRQQCTGFIYGLSMADAFIRTGLYKNILLVGAEVHSKGIDKTTAGRNVAVLFGDGAGAMVLKSTDVSDVKTDPHILSTHIHAQGEFAKELWVASPGTGLKKDERITTDDLVEGRHYPYMNGKKVFVHAIKRMSESINELLEFNNVKKEQIDKFFFHQANLRINESIGQHLDIPADLIFNTIQYYGNTTAATIPIGMYDALNCDNLKPGMLIALSAFGSGFTWGSSLIRY